MASPSLDSLLEAALAGSRPSSAQDMLMLAVHASLISSGYECIAIGDDNFGEESARTKQVVSSSSQPVLPDGWNPSQEVCALQYRHKETKELCLVKGIPLGDQLLLSAVAACHSSEVFTTTLGIADYVQVKGGASFSSKSAFINLLQLITVINRDIESKLTNVCNSASIGRGIPTGAAVLSGGEMPGQVGERREDLRPKFEDDPLRVGPSRQPRIPPPGVDSDPLRVGPPRRPGRPVRDPDPLADVGPFGYGDRDRLPLGGGGPGLGGIGGGGGMIYDPLRQGGRPGFGGLGPHGPYPPNHPPGARFDPVTPFPPQPRPPSRYPPNQGPNFYGEPGPDHLPPPGYDDMFS